MGGMWESMIATTGRILGSMILTLHKHLSHDVLMAEVCSIVNARPLVPVSSDPELSYLLSPGTLLTMKVDHVVQSFYSERHWC